MQAVKYNANKNNTVTQIIAIFILFLSVAIASTYIVNIVIQGLAS